MSRIANAPIVIPDGVEVSLSGNALSVKGNNGTMDFTINKFVDVSIEGGALLFKAKKESSSSVAMAGTMRALANNLVIGVSQGFEKKLELIGVGYRAQVQNKKLNLTLGFSHAVEYDIPDGITIETPSQTEILVRGIDKQKVGQVSANIRAWRPPEPYKGKGIRYADEHIIRKEAKKK